MLLSLRTVLQSQYLIPFLIKSKIKGSEGHLEICSTIRRKKQPEIF